VFETLAAAGIAAGFVFVIRLTAGPGTGDPELDGLFTYLPMPARPRGVQETDLAPFTWRHSPSATRSRSPRAPSVSAPSKVGWTRHARPDPISLRPRLLTGRR
jgi:hypothetical protein